MEGVAMDPLDAGLAYLDLFTVPSPPASSPPREAMQLELPDLLSLEAPFAMNSVNAVPTAQTDLFASALRGHSAPEHAQIPPSDNVKPEPVDASCGSVAGAAEQQPVKLEAQTAQLNLEEPPAAGVASAPSLAAAGHHQAVLRAAPGGGVAKPARSGRATGSGRTVVVARSGADADAMPSESDTDDGSAHGGGKGKRRRRIRNAKQQELNRLAQQRYRERKKQKYSSLQGTVEDLSQRLGTLSTLEAVNSELCQRNDTLEAVVRQQAARLDEQQDTIAKQEEQLQSQAAQLQQQRLQVAELHSRLAALGAAPPSSPLATVTDNLVAPAPAAARSSTGATATAPGPVATHTALDADVLNDELLLAVRTVLAGVSSMAPVAVADRDAVQMQAMVTQLPDALLQRLRSCCREVALVLQQSDVKDTPHAITVPCC